MRCLSQTIPSPHPSVRVSVDIILMIPPPQLLSMAQYFLSVFTPLICSQHLLHCIQIEARLSEISCKYRENCQLIFKEAKLSLFLLLHFRNKDLLIFSSIHHPIQEHRGSLQSTPEIDNNPANNSVSVPWWIGDKISEVNDC